MVYECLGKNISHGHVPFGELLKVTKVFTKWFLFPKLTYIKATLSGTLQILMWDGIVKGVGFGVRHFQEYLSYRTALLAASGLQNDAKHRFDAFIANFEQISLIFLVLQ